MIAQTSRILKVNENWKSKSIRIGRKCCLDEQITTAVTFGFDNSPLF